MNRAFLLRLPDVALGGPKPRQEDFEVPSLLLQTLLWVERLPVDLPPGGGYFLAVFADHLGRRVKELTL